MMKRVDGVTVKRPTHAFTESVGIAIEEALRAIARLGRACNEHELNDPWYGLGIVLKEICAGPVRDRNGDLVRELDGYTEDQSSNCCSGVNRKAAWFYRVVRIQFSRNRHVEVTVFGELYEKDGRKTIGWLNAIEMNPISIYAPLTAESADVQLVYCEPGEEWMREVSLVFDDTIDGDKQDEWLFVNTGESRGMYIIRKDMPSGL